MNIYVGNLSYEVTEEDIGQAFKEFGQVESVKIITASTVANQKGSDSWRCPLKLRGSLQSMA